jgi:hypothetical protein
MTTHGIFEKTLVAAFVLGLTSVASAHNFPKPQTKADIAAERAAACRAAAQPAKRTVARFGPPSVVKSGPQYRVVGAHRFRGASYVLAVACTRPMRGTVASR